MSSDRPPGGGRSVGVPRAAVRRSGGPLVVELIGTPGAGKTTMSREIVRLLRERGLEAGTPVDVARDHAARTASGRAFARLAPARLRRGLLWQLFYLLATAHALRFGREHRALVRHVWIGQRARPIPRRVRRHIRYWFFQLGGRHRFLTTTANDREALVFDDGFLHRSVHLHTSHLEEPDADRVTAYVDLLPVPDLVVVVSANHDVCERRVRERGVWAHSRRLSGPELSCYLANAERVVHTAVQRARERGWAVVEVENGGRALEQIRGDLRAVEAFSAFAAIPPMRTEAVR